MYSIGTSKTEITAFKKGAGMLGYGIHFNTMEAIETPLYARAFIIKNEQQTIAFVNCELCFITIALKQGVIKKINRLKKDIEITEANLMLTAQHTHSGPGGYDHHGFYNVSIPGFSFEIYQTLCTQIAKAIIEAYDNLQANCTIEFGEAPFEENIPVAFNRSIKAYNANKNVEPLTFEQRHLAVDRNMYLLSFKDEQGNPLGSVNWFGVHTTSISNDNNKICSDNKGYAAEYLETYFQKKEAKDYVAAFAQGSCGDVSPKFIYNKKRNFQRGYWDGVSWDDFESAKANGTFQFEQAEKIIRQTNIVLKNRIACLFNFFNAAQVKVDPEFNQGIVGASTGHATFGVSFLEGSPTDGPALPKMLGWIGRRFSTFYYYVEYFKKSIQSPDEKERLKQLKEVQGNKHCIIGAGNQTVYYGNHMARLLIPDFVDPNIESLRYFYKQKVLGDKPWVNEILPIQIILLGEIAIVGIPAEITTVAARRLQASVKKQLLSKGVEHVILSPYANTYAGYITTYEEYQTQHYEGGHTLFGKWTLAAFQTAFKDLLTHSGLNQKMQLLPTNFTEKEIERGKFYIRPWYKRKQKKLEKVLLKDDKK